MIYHLPHRGAAPGAPSHALPTGGCCSPLRPSRAYAGAFSTRTARAAPGSRFLPSVGSGAACRLAPRPVAHPPTRQGAGSLGLAGRGVRWPHHGHPTRWRVGFCALAIARHISLISSRPVCGAAQSHARLRWGAPLHCGRRQRPYIMAHPPGACWGLATCVRPGHRSRTPAHA